MTKTLVESMREIMELGYGLDSNDPDAKTIKLKSGDTITIAIDQDLGDPMNPVGDLSEDVPNIIVYIDGHEAFRMTWNEVRVVADAMNKVTNIAEFG